MPYPYYFPMLNFNAFAYTLPYGTNCNLHKTLMNTEDYTKSEDSTTGVITFTPKAKQYTAEDVVPGMKFHYQSAPNGTYCVYHSYMGKWICAVQGWPYNLMDTPLTTLEVVDMLNSGRILLVKE
jgi:hypothetical protein